MSEQPNPNSENLKMHRQAALIETVLFLETDPVPVEKLSKITGLTEQTVAAALIHLSDACKNENRGLELSQLGGGYFLMPKEEHWEILKERYGKKNDDRLSRAALETLSIIAYSQPITKSEIEKIRGVSADTMIRNLLDKDLIVEKGRKEAPGRPMMYGTTLKFLSVFKLKSISDLPKLGEAEKTKFELN